MLVSFLTSVVNFSRKFAGPFAIAALLLSALLGVYVVQHISINTDINQLLSDNLDWRVREKALEAAFPQKADTIVVIIDGETGAKAEAAAAALAEKVAAKTDQFTFVSRPDALPFFRTKGILFLSQEELAGVLDQIAQAQPMFGTIVSDPTLHGFMGTIGMMMQGVEEKAVDAAQIERPLTEITKTLEAALNGGDHPLDWRMMMPEENDPFAARELRKYIIAKPVLDYSSLQPGQAASGFVRQAAAELNLNPENGVHVRLTGSVPLNDDEFASVSKGAKTITAVCGLLVFGLLFWRCGRGASWRPSR